MIFVAGGAFAAGLLLGAMLMHNDVDAPLEVRQGSYMFINPLLECEIAQESIRQQALMPFKKDVIKVIEDHKSQGALIDASVYFRDLNNGPWFGVGERERFAPASLLKIVTMMATLHIAETDGTVFQKKLRLSKLDGSYRQNIIPAKPLMPGAAYTVDELLNRMIALSDNDALYLLNDLVGVENLVNIYRDLGVPVPTKIGDHILTVKEYASFFRILFNASYLNRSMSERGLQYLSRSKYTTGIVAGVPPTIPVAHKFGEREIYSPDGSATKQLHDCGIVYFPDHPYLLCIMTRGKDFDELSRTIQDISRTVYNELQDQYE